MPRCGKVRFSEDDTIIMTPGISRLPFFQFF
jgi:hypothetical protein